MDFVSAKLAFDALKGTKELLSSAFDARVDAEARPKVQAALGQLNEAMNALFEMRAEMFSMQSENQRLTSELAAADTWHLKTSKYLLTKTSGGAVVYSSLEPPAHHACPSCFEKQSLQVLQDKRSFGHFVCPSCKTEYPVEPMPPMGTLGKAKTDYDPFS